VGTISNGTGLISGIDTKSLIDSLIQLEAQPQTLVKNRVSILQSEKAAFLDISARLLALQNSATSLADVNLFKTKLASSSIPAVLTATATNSAAIGTYNFAPRRLVSTHSLISRGYADADVTPVTGTDTSFTFESADARLDHESRLSELRGGAGIERGKIRITDRGGSTADIDLTSAVTLNDVIDAINTAGGINVTASAEGDHLKLTDNTGSVTGNLVVANLGTTATATSLGIVGSVAAASITGSQINFINADTRLSNLNDGNGVRAKGTGQNDLAITTRSGASVNIILFGATSIGDVITKINDAGAGSLTASVGADGTSLKIVDNTIGGSTFSIAAATGSNAAKDLGLVGSDDNADGAIDGTRLLASIGSKLLKNLNGGSGVGFATGNAALSGATRISSLFNGTGLPTSGDPAADIQFKSRDGQTLDVDLDSLSTVQNLIDTVNTAFSGGLTVGINGQSLTVTDTTSGAGNFTVADLGTSTAAAKLGLAIDSAAGGASDVTGVDTQALNHTGISITNRLNTTTTVDLSAARSVDDVIAIINASAAGVTASLNSAGNGLKLTDTTNGTASNLIIADSSGTAATDLGIATVPLGVAASTVEGKNLDFRWVSETTRLDELNGAKGVAKSTFRITDSTGATAVVDLSNSAGFTLQKVIDIINTRPTGIRASINAKGDGLQLTDTAGGPLAIKVQEGASTTAADLNLLKTVVVGGVVDGSYEQTVAIAAGDTLTKVADKINAAGVNVTASIVNDGSASTPFRLTFSSKSTGTAGRILVDDGAADFQASDLVKGDDSVVLFGSADPAKALLLTSSSNTLTNTVQGVTINLLSTSTSPVQLTISRDDASISTTIGAFAQTFNDVLTTIGKYDTFNADTKQAGLLLGDSTVATIRNRLLNLVNNKVAGVTGQFNFLTQVGLSIGANASLTFNKDRFAAAIATDPNAVTQLFTATSTAASSSTGNVTLPAGVTIPGSSTQKSIGFGKVMTDVLKRITDTVDGTLTATTQGLDSQMKIGTDRIAQMQTILDAHRINLQNQFNAMETALAKLQSQQSSLGSLANLTN
jgi:flagellar hook-associated protein 2